MPQCKVFIAKFTAIIITFLCSSTAIAQNVKSQLIPPLAKNDTILIGKNQSVEINVLFNDIDPDGNINLSTIQIVSGAQLGLANVLNKKIEYTGGTNVCGFDSLKYRLTDNNAELSNIATVYIEITCFNIAPIAINDELNVNEDELDSIDVFENDRYTDGPGLGFNIVNQPNHGNASINNNGILRYTSALNYTGLDTLRYSFCDADPTTSLCDTAFVFITVNPINDKPIAKNDTLSIFINQTKNIDLQLNDFSIDGPSVMYSILTPAINGFAQVTSNGICEYTAGNTAVKDSLRYEFCDLASPSLCDSAWLIINTLPIFQTPTTNKDTLRVLMNTSTSINILQNDIFPNNINSDSVYISNIPSSGTFIYSDSIISYTPVNNFTGEFVLHYYVKDDIDSISNEADIIILINTAAESIDICSIQTTVNQALLINPFQHAIAGTSTINFGSIIINKLPVNGILEGYNYISRSIKYNPNQNFVGADSITFRILDVDGFTSEEIKICIEVLNDIPVSTLGVISPNGDGINDYLTFDKIDEFPDNEVIIFDRYWNEIFHTKSYSNSNYWNAENINTGTYFYLVTIKVNSISKTIKGYISVLK